MKAYTDLEQSKKLTEFLPIESADMTLPFRHTQKDEYIPEHVGTRSYIDVYNEMIALPGMDKEQVCKLIQPCWSLAALMHLLPSEFTERGEHSETTYKIDIRKYALTDDVDIYQIAYGNYNFYEDGSHSWKDIVNSGQKENLIDAVFQMVIWLKENKKI